MRACGLSRMNRIEGVGSDVADTLGVTREGVVIMGSKYGKCECGYLLEPIWFTEEQTDVSGGIMIKTGRKRKACSHLVCSGCLRNYCVDDSFDSSWR